jgi:photosystem II stability/assembly factor-like uncharacterized protein
MKKLYILISLMFIASLGSAQWTNQNSGTTLDLTKVFFPNNDTGYVLTGYSILKTYNGGNTWSLNANNKPYNIDFTSGKIGYSAEGDSIMKSVDAGNTWSPIFFDKNVGYVISFINKDSGFAIGSTYGDTVFTYKTVNAGNNWTLVSSYAPGFPFYYITKVVFLTKDIGFFIHNGLNGNIFRTQDGGMSWTPVYNPTAYVMYDLNFPSLSIGYAAGQTGMTAKTVDGGLTWTLINTLVTTDPLYSVCFISIDTGFVCGGNGINSGAVLQTNDGGSTWFVSTSVVQTMQSVYFPSVYTGYAVGTNGKIMKYTNGTASNNDLSISNNFSIFPNPTHDNLTIETPEKATIEILNIEGQIIKTINTADKQATIDVADLSSGIYIIKAKTEKGIAVKKFIKE